MKLLMENWRKFLTEENLPLGKIAFADEDDYEAGTDEEDTGQEVALIKMLKAHFHDDVPLTKEATDLIINLIDKGLYPETFQRFQKGDAYMGFHAPIGYFEKRFGPLPEKPKWYRAPIAALQKRATKSFKDDPSGPSYVPRQKEATQMSLFPELNKRTASSWTTDFKIAEQFRSDGSYDEVSMILVADATDPANYFINAEPLYKYDFATAYSDEDEVLGVGDIKIKDLIWFYEYYEDEE